MKTIKDICDATGVSRRTIQRYEENCLFSPAGKGHNNCFLYDDIIIKKVGMIQMFLSAGFTIEEIKRFLDSPDATIENEIKKAITQLEQKRILTAYRICNFRLALLSSRLYGITDHNFLDMNIVVSVFPNSDSSRNFGSLINYPPYWKYLDTLVRLRSSSVTAYEVTPTVTLFLESVSSQNEDRIDTRNRVIECLSEEAALATPSIIDILLGPGAAGYILSIINNSGHF